MSTIEFTQHILPDGRTKPIYFDGSNMLSEPVWVECVEKYDQLTELGFTFHAEILRDGHTVSLTAVDPDDEGDCVNILSQNDDRMASKVLETVREAFTFACDTGWIVITSS
jgi:hypothetical protein